MISAPGPPTARASPSRPTTATRQFYDISVMDLATGARIRLLEGSNILTVPSWSPDGARLLVIEDHSSTDGRLWLLDVATGAATRVPAPAPTRYASVRWTIDGAALMGLTDHGGTDFMRLCRIDPATGEASLVYEAPGRDVEAWSLSPGRRPARHGRERPRLRGAAGRCPRRRASRGHRPAGGHRRRPRLGARAASASPSPRSRR